MAFNFPSGAARQEIMRLVSTESTLQRLAYFVSVWLYNLGVATGVAPRSAPRAFPLVPVDGASRRLQIGEGGERGMGGEPGEGRERGERGEGGRGGAGESGGLGGESGGGGGLLPLLPLQSAEWESMLDTRRTQGLGRGFGRDEVRALDLFTRTPSRSLSPPRQPINKNGSRARSIGGGGGGGGGGVGGGGGGAGGVHSRSSRDLGRVREGMLTSSAGSRADSISGDSRLQGCVFSSNCHHRCPRCVCVCVCVCVRRRERARARMYAHSCMYIHMHMHNDMWRYPSSCLYVCGSMHLSLSLPHIPPTTFSPAYHLWPLLF